MRIAAGLAALAGLAPKAGWAHSFGEPYKLPMPYWLYIYGAMAALVLSFLILAYVFKQAHAQRAPHSWPLPQGRLASWIRRGRIGQILQGLVLLGFGLAVATGLWGRNDSHRNFNMTFFWIVFALGGTYLSAAAGNWYALLSPWKTLTQLLNRVFGRFAQGRCDYPRRLAYWPALALYMVFIGLELFGKTRPFSLSVALLCYTAINLGAVWCFGARSWFRYGEFFAVMFRLVAGISPLCRQARSDGRRRLALRLPCSGLQQHRLEHISLLVFLLFMLSSTAFDGLRETRVWFKLFWQDPFNLLTPLLGKSPIYLYLELRPWYIAYETVCLVLSPFLYLLLFGLFLGLGKLLSRCPLSLTELALRFGSSLLPIAVVYHLTHYYSLLLSQGIKIRGLVSDPFGWNWNLFGTAITGRIPILPDMGFIWYSQVWLILIGHMASVYLAHAEALNSFPSRRQALLSQLPMLVLMVIFTGAGLWILAQPLQG